MTAAAETILGTGDWRYVAVPGWARLPDGWRFHNVAGLGVDSRNDLYVFDRGPHPLMVFDRTGRFLRSWGEGLFKRPHAVHVGPDDTVWLTDDADHCVRQFTPEGRLLLTLGVPGQAAPYAGGRPFNRCTHTAISPDGDVYVSDGYGNACVHKFDAAGRHLLSWGSPGTLPGEFNIPHNITCDGDGRVYVADRENHRVQVFDGNGRFLTQWHDMHKPCGMYMRPGRCRCCYIAEAGPPHFGVNRDMPNIGPRVSIWDMEGRLLGRFGGLRKEPGGPAHFLGLHAIAVNGVGEVFVADLAVQTWGRNHPDVPAPDDLPSLHVFRPVEGDVTRG